MSKQGKLRTMSICVSDIPKERILLHENGKKISLNRNLGLRSAG